MAHILYVGLKLWEQEDMLISGHPVAWDIEHGSKFRELLVIVHKQGYNAEHWAVRINRATQRVTHVTAGPLLHRRNYQPDVSHAHPLDAPETKDQSPVHAPTLLGQCL